MADRQYDHTATVMYARYFVLFAMLFTGWFLRKINFIDDRMNHSINKLVVYFAYPCMIVHNIGTLEMTRSVISQFLITFVLSLALFYIYGFVTWGYAKLRKYPKDISNVAEFAMAMPNDGFMGFPVALIFFGETGLLLMLAHNAAMNFFTFTYGIRLMRRNKDGRPKWGRPSLPVRILRATLKFLLNPNILATMLGFAVGLMGRGLPQAVDDYLLYLGGVSTPMAMIFIGSNLTNYNLLETVKDLRVLDCTLMKLLWLPALTFGLVYFLPVAGIIKCCVVLGIAFPTAATVSMLSEQEGQSVGMASRVLFISTMVSIVSVPLTVKFLTYMFL